jgi:hypothetical protein
MGFKKAFKKLAGKRLDERRKKFEARPGTRILRAIQAKKKRKKAKKAKKMAGISKIGLR